MIPEPLNGKKDDKPPRRSIAGHLFDPLNGKCSIVYLLQYYLFLYNCKVY